jgi:hypothetical protein
MLNAQECRRQAAVCRAEGEHWSQHNFDAYGAKLGNACPPDGSLTGHPRPEISLFNRTESVPWARRSCNERRSSHLR